MDLINIDALADALLKRIKPELQNNEPELLAYTVDQAAKAMNIGASTLRLMIKNREIQVVRRGTRVLITRSAILQWLEDNAA